MRSDRVADCRDKMIYFIFRVEKRWMDRGWGHVDGDFDGRKLGY